MIEHQQRLGACRTSYRDCETSGQILLVGEDNPLSAEPQHALFCYPANCAGERLQDKIFGLLRAPYLAMWRTNLCVGGWKMKAARERAAAIVADTGAPWSVIVLLGQKVTDAFTSPTLELPETFSHCPVEDQSITALSDAKVRLFVRLPHPSGRNRIWNNPGVIRSVRKLMSEVAPGVPWGQGDSL